MSPPLIPDIDAFEERVPLLSMRAGSRESRRRTWQHRRRAFVMLTTTGSGWQSMSWVGLLGSLKGLKNFLPRCPDGCLGRDIQGYFYNRGMPVTLATAPTSPK
jgi:hypothetical protein